MPFDPASLTFDAAGLVPCIAQDADSGDVLMMAWMSDAAIRRTLETGRVTYWSRSRQAFWVKGESSGHVQTLVELRVDCDRDCLLALVRHLTSLGIGVLITDHNVRETLGLIDRAYIIHSGEVLFEGRPEEIVESPEVRRLYLGEQFSL